MEEWLCTRNGSRLWRAGSDSSPYVGLRYRSAIRVETQPERKRVLYERLLCPYYNNNSSLTKRQMALHGIR